MQQLAERPVPAAGHHVRIDRPTPAKAPARRRFVPATRNDLVEFYYPQVKRMVRGMALHTEGQTAEDYLQEAAILLCEAVDLHLDRCLANPVGMAGLMRNWVRLRLISRARSLGAVKNRLGPTRLDDIGEDAKELAVSDTVPLPDEELREAIESLPAFERNVVLLYYGEDLTEVEIARRFGKTPAAIRYRREGALARLRAWYNGDVPRAGEAPFGPALPVRLVRAAHAVQLDLAL